MLYRQGTVNDVDSVFALNQQSFAEAWSKASLLQVMQAGFDLYVAESKGFCIAYILSQDILDEVHIMQIAVHPDYRRQGIGKQLTRILLQEKKCSALLAMLEVRASNTAAQAMYRHLGFEHMGTRPRYYSPLKGSTQREDAMIMQYNFKTQSS